MTKPNYVLQTNIRCTPKPLWDVLRDTDAVIHYDFMTQSAKPANFGNPDMWEEA